MLRVPGGKIHLEGAAENRVLLAEPVGQRRPAVAGDARDLQVEGIERDACRARRDLEVEPRLPGSVRVVKSAARSSARCRTLASSGRA